MNSITPAIPVAPVKPSVTRTGIDNGAAIPLHQTLMPKSVWLNAAEDVQPSNVTQSAAEWAKQQWSGIKLGDARLEHRAVRIGTAIAEHPAQSLPQQMSDPVALRGAYYLLNHPGVTLERLSQQSWEGTRQAASQQKVVLFVQDTTELDYTRHPTKEGLGPIGDGKGRGLLLHSTLAVVPDATPQILGLAHQQVVLREPVVKPRPNYTSSPEGQVWAVAAEAIGKPPESEEVLWVHVGDRGSDDFRFMHTCDQADKHFLIRVMHNRLLEWDQEDIGPKMRKLVDFARTRSVQHCYELKVPAQRYRPARTAQMCLSWAQVIIPAPQRSPPELRHQRSISVCVIRAWEVHAPAEVEEPIEWILITSVPTRTVDEAKERVRWYTYRWLTEDYHQCLKTGCAIEKRQLDHGDDICRLLGFLGPTAAWLLQMRNFARIEPQVPAARHIAPLMSDLLIRKLQWTVTEPLTMGDFWRGVAQLGGHQGRPGDGPPGWKIIWRGWLHLSDLVTGARLYADALACQQVQAGLSPKFGATPVDWFH